MSFDAVRGDEKMPSFFFKKRNRAAHKGQGPKAAKEHSTDSGRNDSRRIYAPSARRPVIYSLGDLPDSEKTFIAATTEPNIGPLQPSRGRNLPGVDKVNGEGGQVRGRVARVNDGNCE